MKRKIIGLLCMFFLIGLIVGCGEEKKVENTEIVIINGWGMMDENHQIMRDIYEDFQENNPDITLKLISMPSSDKVIEKAKEILETGEYRVCEVGEMVGIEDPAYFTHVFLKYEGKSPSDFMNR